MQILPNISNITENEIKATQITITDKIKASIHLIIKANKSTCEKFFCHQDPVVPCENTNALEMF